eukprot:scaffold7468_cov126-Skeletonema_dohrnii-CCMP3373.AAC.1
MNVHLNYKEPLAATNNEALQTERHFRSVAMSVSYANIHASITSINVSLSLFDVTDNAVTAELQAFTYHVPFVLWIISSRHIASIYQPWLNPASSMHLAILRIYTLRHVGLSLVKLMFYAANAGSESALTSIFHEGNEGKSTMVELIIGKYKE